MKIICTTKEKEYLRKVFNQWADIPKVHGYCPFAFIYCSKIPLGDIEYGKKCRECIKDHITWEIIDVTPVSNRGGLISHVALKDKCNEIMQFNPTTDRILDLIDNAPTIESEILTKEAYSDLCLRASQARPQGEWIIVKDERYGDNVKCPFCGKELAGTDLNFCCKCGAEMRGKEE